MSERKMSDARLLEAAIEREVSQKYFPQIKFLLMGQHLANEIETCTTIKQLFKNLFSNQSNLPLVYEILRCLGFQKLISEHGNIANDKPITSSPQISSYRKLLFDIAKNMTKTDLKDTSYEIGFECVSACLHEISDESSEVRRTRSASLCEPAGQEQNVRHEDHLINLKLNVEQLKKKLQSKLSKTSYEKVHKTIEKYERIHFKDESDDRSGDTEEELVYNLPEKNMLQYLSHEHTDKLTFKGSQKFVAEPGSSSGVDIIIKKHNIKRNAHYSAEKFSLIYRIKHPFVVPLIAVSHIHSRPEDDYQSLLLMYPKFKMTLDQYLRSISSTPDLWTNLLRIFWQIARAVRYLHQKVTFNDKTIRGAVYHNNISTTTIVLDQDGNACLLGVGLYPHDTIQVPTDTSESDTYDTSDTIVKQTFDTVETDMTKLAGVLKQILTLQCGMTNTDWPELENLKQSYRKDVWSNSKLAADLITMCGQCPRMTAAELCRHLETLRKAHSVDCAVTYRVPKDNQQCVSCRVHPIATDMSTQCHHVSLNNRQQCDHHFFCRVCLRSSFQNPLECPLHGAKDQTYGPIGHPHTFALLISGYESNFQTTIDEDVLAVHNVLVDPTIIGVRSDHLYCYLHKIAGPAPVSHNLITLDIVRDTMQKLKEKFKQVPLDCQHSTLFLYYSGHSDVQGNLQLTSTQVVLKFEELQEWLNYIAKYCCNIIFIKDCCYAGKTTPIDLLSSRTEEVSNTCTRNLSKASGMQGDRVLSIEKHPKFKFLAQLSSSAPYQTSAMTPGSTSPFTKYMLEALRQDMGNFPKPRALSTTYLTVEDIHNHAKGKMGWSEPFYNKCGSTTEFMLAFIGRNKCRRFKLRFVNDQGVVIGRVELEAGQSAQEIFDRAERFWIEEAATRDATLYEITPSLRHQCIQFVNLNQEELHHWAELAPFCYSDQVFCRVRTDIRYLDVFCPVVNTFQGNLQIEALNNWIKKLNNCCLINRLYEQGRIILTTMEMTKEQNVKFVETFDDLFHQCLQMSEEDVMVSNVLDKMQKALKSSSVWKATWNKLLISVYQQFITFEVMN